MWRGASTARQADSPGPRAALTFDDGPDTRWTPAALDMLRKRNAKATFFMLGSFVQQHPDLAKTVIEAGHEVGNHGWDHRHMTTMSAEELADSLLRSHKVITDATGSVPALMRPPYGQFDAASAWAIARVGYSITLWSHRMTADDPWERAKQNIATATDGMIMLSHDGRGTPTEDQMKAAGWMIDEMQKQGWSFVSVSELLGESNR
ncbi:MAG TPA: polysaccharide deacetylase family protein [Kribbellaceae bacterium]|nr:polysaccharide deacetylase family protein [Kribbellaceae bacterium]